MRHVVSAADIGRAVRQKRVESELTQHQLAARIGATRQWVNRLEQGSTQAAMSRVMDVLAALGLELVAEFDEERLGDAEPSAGRASL